MTFQDKKKEFELFCGKKRWFTNIPVYASEFFGVSEATIRKWQSIDSRIPDSAMNLIFKEYELLEVQEQVKIKNDALRATMSDIKNYLSAQKRLEELVHV